MRIYCLALFTIVHFLGLSLHAQDKLIPHLIHTYPISGDGGWDYLSIQSNSTRLFVSHGTEVNIINSETGDSLGIIKGLNGVHGIAFVPGLNKGYISDGRGNTIIVFNLSTYAVTGEIKAGENPDAIFYETGIKKIIVCNGKTKDVAVIDPATDHLVASIPVEGKPETAASDGQFLYVNIEDKNEIAVVDLSSFKVVGRWSLQSGKAPSGMVLDNQNHILFTACSESNQLLVIDTKTGKIIARIPIGEDCDALGFDKSTKQIYASNRGGTLTVIEQVNKDKYIVKANVATKYGAKTLALDESTHKIFLSCATLKKGATEERPTVVPGTFSIMVFQ
jgi:YVTN family beta-propeller protein